MPPVLEFCSPFCPGSAHTEIMLNRKSVAVVVAGTVALESVVGDPKRAPDPHAENPEHVAPRPVAKVAIVYQSSGAPSATMRWTLPNGVRLSPWGAFTMA